MLLLKNVKLCQIYAQVKVMCRDIHFIVYPPIFELLFCKLKDILVLLHWILYLLLSFRNCSTVRYNWQATGLLWQLFVTAPCINLVTGDYVNMLPQSVTVG